MFSSGSNYTKLKTSLKLCINRLKLLEKKKTEMALKSRKEIADYIAAGKPERAKIRVEHIIREDYYVEAMEIVEMYCDLLLARFGLIEQMKNLDDGLAESISSLIWVAPRLLADVPELKTVSDQFVVKYGKPYGLACRENSVGTVSEKLMHKMSVQAPPKLTVEKYLIEIAKYYNVDYQPDPQVMLQDEAYAVDALVDLAPPPPNKNDLDSNSNPGGSSGNGGNNGGGGFTYPAMPIPPGYPYPPGAAAYTPPPAPMNSGPPPPGPSSSQNLSEKDFLRMNEEGPPPYFPNDPSASAPPATNFANLSSQNENKNPSQNLPTPGGASNLDLPELPTVPSDTPTHSATGSFDEKKNNDEEEDIDFDDLTRRFEALKKKK